MALMADIGAVVTQAVSDPSAPQGLELVEGPIDDVVARIDAELDLISPTQFETRGHIPPSSFGGGDRAPALASDYTRAHDVVAETLKGVKLDLQTFQNACRDAKRAIVDADEESSSRTRVTQLVIDKLAVGSQGHYGDRAYRDAQQNQNTSGNA